MGIFVTKEEKETQKLQRQEFLAAQKLRDEKASIGQRLKNKSITEQLAEEALEKATLSNLSDRDIQVAILKTNRKTNLWITFIGWVVLIGIAFNIIMALGLLSL